MSLSSSDIRSLVVTGISSLAGGVLCAAQLPYLGVPLAAAALGWLTYRHGYIAGIVTAVLTGVVVIPLGGLASAVFVVPALLAAGPGAAWVLLRWPALRVVAILACVIGVTALAADVMIASLHGMTFLAARAADATTMRTWMAEAAARSSLSALEARQLADQAYHTMFTLWPTGYVWLGSIVAVLSVPLVVRAGRAIGRPVNLMPKLPELDVTPHIVWPTIAALGLLAAAAYLNQPNGWIQAAGQNLLLCVRPILFFQGLAGFAALYRKANVRLVPRVFGVFFLVFSELLLPSVSVIGAVDLFVNFRKLPRGGVSTPAGVV